MVPAVDFLFVSESWKITEDFNGGSVEKTALKPVVSPSLRSRFRMSNAKVQVWVSEISATQIFDGSSRAPAPMALTTFRFIFTAFNNM